MESNTCILASAADTIGQYGIVFNYLTDCSSCIVDSHIWYSKIRVSVSCLFVVLERKGSCEGEFNLHKA